jgi:hypothetical protein
VREHRDKPRVAAQHVLEDVEPGELAGDRTVPAVDDDRHTRVGEEAPHGFEQLVARVVTADLDVRLHAPDTLVERLGEVAAGTRFGEERGGRHSLRGGCRELADPLVEPRRHVRLVWVHERREPRNAQVTQGGEPLVGGQPVVDGPLGAVLGARAVEERPHLLLHGVRQEVDVQVGQAGEAQRSGERRDLRIRTGDQ